MCLLSRNAEYCEGDTRSNNSSTNCFCDSLCKIYKDCCRDSEYYLPDEQIWGTSLPAHCQCIGEDCVYMTASCPEGQQIDGCVKTYRPIIDPIFDVPVTSSRTNITYKNVHCAICNKDFDATVDTLWDIAFNCGELSIINLKFSLRGLDTIPYIDEQELQERFLECIEFDHIMQYWKLNLSCTYYKLHIRKGHESHVEDLNLGYEECFLVTPRPNSIRRILRPCDSRMIGTCSPQVGHKDILRRCESYQDIISMHGCIYRNPYCLSCWRSDCQILYSVGLPSFKVLLKWNSIGGSKCDGVQEDKFKQSCRKLPNASHSKFLF